MPAPGSPFGLLFDLDGTLTDSDRAHVAAFRALLGEFNRELSDAEYREHISGGANPAIMRHLFPALDVAEHERLADRKEQLFRDLSPTLDPVRGLHGFLERAAGAGARIGVVTNAPRANAEHMLRALDLSHLLDTIVVGAELPRSKPDPLPYLTGLARLDLPADRVLAFEDSLPGIRSASGAELFTVGLLTTQEDAALRAAGAALTIPDYADPILATLLDRLLAGGSTRP